MSSYCLMFPGVRCSMMFSGFGFKPPATGFQSYFTVVSRLILLYSAIVKTSRLKMKSFSTVRDTQRGSQLHGEEKREEGFRGDPTEMRCNEKRREQASL